MPDPITVSVAAPALRLAVDLGMKLYAAKFSENQAHQLAIRIWGSILFEMRANCNRARHLVQQWERKKDFMLRRLSFTVTDAVLPDLCRLLPEPITLHEMNRVDSSLRTIDFYHRLAAAGEEQLHPSNPTLPPHYGRTLAFAEDLKNRGDLGRFNLLIRTAAGFAEHVFKEQWNTIGPGMIPDEIDLDAPVPGDDS